MEAQANPITRAVLDHLPVLEFLRENGKSTPAQIAAATGRVPSNVRRDLPKLVEADLLMCLPMGADAVDSFVLKLPATLALEAMDRARNPDLAAVVPTTGLHAEFAPNPDQPRKKFDEQKLEELADTVEEVGIIEPIVVLAPREDGLKLIHAGERRWRAAGIVNARHDDPNRVRIPFVIRDVAAEDAALEAQVVALVENGQRENLTTYEEAVALRALIPAKYRSARAAAKPTGFDEKTVQDRLKALATLTGADLEAWKEDRLTWREVRDIFRPPAQAEADPAQMDIEEVTGGTSARPQVAESRVPAKSSTDRTNERWAREQKEREQQQQDEMTSVAADMPDDVEGLSIVAQGAIEDYHEAVLAIDADRAKLAAQRYDGAVWKLNGGTRSGCEGGPNSAAPVLRRATAATDGDEPKWGQSGRFLIRVDGTLAHIEVKGGVGEYLKNFEFHVVELDAPFFSNTGFRSEYFAHGLPSRDGASVAVEVARIMRRNIAAQKKPQLVDPQYIDRRDQERIDQPWIQEQIDSKGVYNGVDLIEAHEAAREEAAKVASAAAALSRSERVALIEATHKALTHNVATTGRAAQIGAYWLDAGCSHLKDAGLLTFVQAGGELGWCVMWGEKAYAWFKANLPEAFNGEGELAISDAQLALAQAEAATMAWSGPIWNGPGYVTPWLNGVTGAIKADAEVALDGQGAAGPIESSPETQADDGHIEQRDHDLAWNVSQCIEYPDQFPAMFEATGIKLPLKVGTGLDLGVIFDADGEGILTVDPHGARPTGWVAAVSMLVAAALEDAVDGHEVTSEPVKSVISPDKFKPADMRRSITPWALVCLEDGRSFTSLKRHLKVVHGLTWDEYRAKWGLPADYPSVAPYSMQSRADAARAVMQGLPK